MKLLAAMAMLSGVLLPTQSDKLTSAAIAGDGPAFTPAKELQFPSRYREWVYLTSGLDMTYNAKADASGMSMFGNVFVNPGSYREFQKTGAWPDGTALVLENRSAIHGGEKQSSINKHGLSQSGERMGVEVHVKDSSLAGGWGFYAFDDQKSVKMIARPASCYTCHEQHAAVDTTFVQFYPTLLDSAKTNGTLSKAYLAEIAASAR